jgi:hypothetical protein
MFFGTIMTRAIRLSFVVFALSATWGPTKKAEKSDSELKQEIIKESITSYRGSRPVHTIQTALVEGAGVAALIVVVAALPGLLRERCHSEMVNDYRKRTGTIVLEMASIRVSLQQSAAHYWT